MKNGSTTIVQRRGNHRNHLAMLQRRQPSRIFMEKNSCCVFGGISLVSYIMSCSNRTRPLLGLYRTQLMRLSRALKEKRAHYYSRHDKIILHDNAGSTTYCGADQNLLRNTQMGSSTPPVVFSRHCSFRLPLVPINDAWPV